jgi:hypothetical protein
MANMCLLVCVPIRCVGIAYSTLAGHTANNDVQVSAADVEDTLVVIALPLSWFFMLFFFRSVQHVFAHVHQLVCTVHYCSRDRSCK